MKNDMNEEEAVNLIRSLMPGLSNEDYHNILWCCTGWPNFFPSGKNIEDCLREAIEDLKKNPANSY